IIGRRDARDPKVFELYNQACTGSYLPGCSELARRYESSGYREYALALYRTACALHEPEACTRLAAIDEQTAGMQGEALAHYEQGCVPESVTGCRSAAAYYLEGKGVPVNRAKALRLLQTGCNGD